MRDSTIPPIRGRLDPRTAGGPTQASCAGGRTKTRCPGCSLDWYDDRRPGRSRRPHRRRGRPARSRRVPSGGGLGPHRPRSRGQGRRSRPRGSRPQRARADRVQPGRAGGGATARATRTTTWERSTSMPGRRSRRFWCSAPQSANGGWWATPARCPPPSSRRARRSKRSAAMKRPWSGTGSPSRCAPTSSTRAGRRNR